MYAELQVSSNFSFLRGASHPEELVARAASLNYQYFALTDLHSVAGIVRAYDEAKQQGITFIPGTRIAPYHKRPEREDDDDVLPAEALYQKTAPLLLPYSLLLYPSDLKSYGRMCRLLTVGKSYAPKGCCYLLFEDIAEFQENLLAVVVSHNPFDSRLPGELQKLKEVFTDNRLSLALNHTYGPDNFRRLEKIKKLAALYRIPLVATNDVHYHIPERRILQDVLTCVRHRCTLGEAGFLLHANAERFIKPQEEIARLFRHCPSAVERSLAIAKRASSFSLSEVSYEYPQEICPSDRTPLEHLTELTRKGAKERYPQGVPQEVKRIIKNELSLIAELKYEKYFLTVYDIVCFARSQKILCQGRGAAANSAVCYVLGITAVDPDRVKLLFERFVSKERNEPPDIDVDFEHERREEVIQYVYEKYGRERAALVASVTTYRTRSAVRDIGKVFELSLEEIELLIKAIRRTDGEVSAADLRKRGLNPRDKRLHQIIALSQELKGFPRHLSQHVGGFIISESPLCEIVPIENARMINRTVVEWDKDDIERMGMLKIDILGLGMLTCIRKAMALLNERRPCPSTPKLELHNIPAEDPATYDMICAADTIGVFQIESRAQMSMLPRLRPRCYHDLVIEVAIVRPGPIQGKMVHPYLKRRKGEEPVVYPDERIKNVLHSTLGVPIFQEQIMELSIVAAGFSPGEADQLRRAMATWKKKGHILEKFGKRIIEGMTSRGYCKQFAKQVFDQIKGFSEYGFPQSHAASFALLVYVSCWLKKHHPAAFAAALINSQPMGFYRPAQLIADAKRHGVPIHPIDVNHSSWDCSLEGKEPALRLGMCLVKGLSEDEAERIANQVAHNGPFYSLRILWRKCGVSVSALRALARADAFCSLGLKRQHALWEIRKFRDEKLPLFETFEQQGTANTKKENTTKGSALQYSSLPVISLDQDVVKDYQFTGFSLKAHPLSLMRAKLCRRGAVTAADIKDHQRFPQGSRTLAAGIVLVRQRPLTASGTVFMTLEDETGMINLIIKPKVFKAFNDVLCDSTILLAQGAIQREQEVIHLMLEDAWPLATTQPSLSRDFH